jgi:REP element-mobilizing transposase RayT
MSRRPRLQFAGGLYHVTARGNRKSTIFHDDEDRRQFLEIFGNAALIFDLNIMAACLMGNHYHAVLETPERNLSDAVQFINGVYAQRSNRRHQQTGHVFEARFRSIVIQRECYLVRAARYVVRNPVAAGLVQDAGAWQWSTYRATAGLEVCPRWLHADWIRWAFKTDDIALARQRYIDYVNAPASSQGRFALSGIVLGSRRYVRKIVDAQQTQNPELELPVNVRTLARPTLPHLFASADGSGPSRDRLIYCARVEHGYRFAQIARYLGIERSTASKAAMRHKTRQELQLHEDDVSRAVNRLTTSSRFTA